MYSGYEHFVKCMCWKYLPPLAEEGLGGERETKRESELGGKGEERWEGGGTKRKRDTERNRYPTVLPTYKKDYPFSTV